MNKKIFKQEVADWDHNASFYATESDSPYKKILRDEMIKKFNISKNHKKILDLGAGIGDLSNDIKNKYKNNVVCVDFSKNMREEALKKYPGTDYVLASAEKLPFKDASFDMVIAGGVLHHLKIQGTLDDGLKEIQRVLKKGGYFCYLDRSSSKFANLYELFLASIKDLFRTFNRNYAASSTTSETSLTSLEIVTIRNKFKLVSRKPIYSMPFKFLMVISNFFLYTLGVSFYFGFQKLTYPLALFFEKKTNYVLWETEFCEVLKK